MLKVIILLLLVTYGTSSQAQPLTRFQPTHEQIVERYKRAAHLDSVTKNSVFRTNVDAHWSADGKSFWYCNILKDSIREYYKVDAATGRKEKITAPARDSATAPAADRRQRNGRFGNFRNGPLSPDKKWMAYIEKGNLFIKAADSSGVTASHNSATGSNNSAITSSHSQTSQQQLTTDGNDDTPYGFMTWSPDSKYLAGYLVHPVKDSSVSFILTSLPGTTRGQVRSRPYKQPGDACTSYDLFILPVDGQPAKVQTETIDFPGFAPTMHWRYNDSRFFYYEKFDRGHQRMRVIEVDANTAQTRNIVDERTKTFIYQDRQYVYYPTGTNSLVRTSEKDGYRHLYTVDLVSGHEQPVTSGEWVVRNIDSIDIIKKQVWFGASGMNRDEDPYLIHYYRIGLDGKNLVALTPDPGTHDVTFSPDHKYYIDNYSLVNVPPVTKLRRSADGKEIAKLEEADLTWYRTLKVSPPEPFVAKARDGVTDIYGIISRPADYDPNKQYPVLENIYAGPHDSFVPKSFTPYSEMQSLAQLGFIVVMIDGMGTANRSKAFHDVCWQNLADAGLPDRIGWIKALAKKYPSVDTTRVGIYGTSAGGQNSLGALLFHPEFYKACVSACGCHDNRVDKQWWNEQWMGYPVGPHYATQSNVTNAEKLQGSVLLIVGEADTNVPPESTYRVADALIQAGKDFDLLTIPGMDHSDGGPYGRIRKRNFFVKHLMGVEPPDINAGELRSKAKNETGRERWSFQ